MIKQRSLLKIILLSIITFGIYGFIFWWGYVKDINKVCEGDGQQSPNFLAVILLSFVTCGIYGLFWYYKQGSRLQAIAPKYGLAFKESGSTVLLWMILGSLLCGIGPLIAMNILIKNLNAVGNAYNYRLQNNQ